MWPSIETNRAFSQILLADAAKLDNFWRAMHFPSRAYKLKTAFRADLAIWQTVLLAGLWLLWLIPVLHTTYLSEVTTVPCPLWDEWVLVGAYLAKLAQGGHLGWHDYLESYVHSRSPIPKLVCIGIARLTHWDVRWGTRLTLLLTFISLASIVWLLARQTFLSIWEKPIFAVVIAAFFFNPIQQTPWYFSAMASNACALTPVVLCTVLWSTRWRFGVKAWLALLLTLIASLSMVTGMVLWLVCPVLMWWTEPPPGERPRRILAQVSACWLVFFGVFVFFYFHNLHASQQSISLADAFWRWPDIVDFMLAMLGFPVSYLGGRQPMLHLRTVSVTMANLHIFALLWVLALNYRFFLTRKGFQQALPWLVFVAYGLGFSLMVTLNRLDIRNSEFVTRYAAYASFFYIGWLGLVRLGIGEAWRHWREVSRGRAVMTWLATATLAVLMAVTAYSYNGSYQQGVRKAEDVYYNSRQSRAAIQFAVACPDMELLNKAAWTNAEHIIEYAPPIAAAGFLGPGLVPSAFMRNNAVLPLDSGQERFKGNFENLSYRGRTALLVRGWAVDTNSKRPVDLVVITATPAESTAEEKVVSIAMETTRRRDISKRFGKIAHNERAGWQVFCDRSKLPLGKSTLRAYAFDTDTLKFYRLPGEKQATNDGTADEREAQRMRNALRTPPALGEELP